MVYLKRFKDHIHSDPSGPNCGLILHYVYGNGDKFWANECATHGTARKEMNNNFVTISSFAVNGTLKNNEGYCIEIGKGMSFGMTIG